jgi:hypothetical protein
MAANPDFDDPIHLWPQPDLGVLRINRRELPVFPVEVFGEFWGELITDAAAGASAPVDYTGCTLLACAGTLIGHARWVSPWQNWNEPPVLWIGNVGDPSCGKSPAADPILGILRDIEIGLAKDYPDAHRQWMTERASAAAHRAIWESEVKDAAKFKKPPPAMPLRLSNLTSQLVPASSHLMPQRKSSLSLLPHITRGSCWSATSSPAGMGRSVDTPRAERIVRFGLKRMAVGDLR